MECGGVEKGEGRRGKEPRNNVYEETGRLAMTVPGKPMVEDIGVTHKKTPIRRDRVVTRVVVRGMGGGG